MAPWRRQDCARIVGQSWTRPVSQRCLGHHPPNRHSSFLSWPPFAMISRRSATSWCRMAITFAFGFRSSRVCGCVSARECCSSSRNSARSAASTHRRSPSAHPVRRSSARWHSRVSGRSRWEWRSSGSCSPRATSAATWPPRGASLACSCCGRHTRRKRRALRDTKR